MSVRAVTDVLGGPALLGGARWWTGGETPREGRLLSL